MKKIISFLFLILFLYNAVGYYPLFIYLQSQAKQEIEHEIKNSLHQEDLTAFSFNEAEYKNLDWIEKNEFRFNGNIYDVVRQKRNHDGNMIVTVIDDKKEKLLFAYLDEQSEENSEDSTTGKRGEKLLELFSTIYLPINGLIYFIPEKLTLTYLNYQTSIASFIREIPSPPPKVV